MFPETILPDHLSYRPEMPFSWQEMLESKQVLSVPDMLRHLRLAQGYLRNTPGPHLEERQESEPEWLGWWISFFEQFGGDLNQESAGAKLLTPQEVAMRNVNMNQQNIITANFFANGLEGHPGHRHAVDYMTSILRRGYVGIMLDEKIASGKGRDSHFLPLQMRLSMWAYFFSYDDKAHGGRLTSLDYLSVIPSKPTDETDDEYYDRVFTESRAIFHFVMKDDPHFNEKFKRNFFGNGWPKDDEPWFVFDPAQTYHVDDIDDLGKLVFAYRETRRTTDRTARLFDPV